MSAVYQDYKDKDQFLYMTYNCEIHRRWGKKLQWMWSDLEDEVKMWRRSQQDEELS